MAEAERPDSVAPLEFPGVARLELDDLLSQLVERAQDVQATQGRLRALLTATHLVTADLDLPLVLRHVVTAAKDLVGVRYAALGVIGGDRWLEQFIHVGLDDDVLDTVGHLPRGEGILGLLVEEPMPLRLPDLSRHPHSAGFPPGHPPMSSFLGVPIRVGDRVFGNLYLTDKAAGAQFTAEDEELVLALAATAGVAIENARLYADARRRQEWQRASAEIASELVSGSSRREALSLIARRTLDVTGAALATVVLPVPGTDRLAVEVAEGPLADLVRGLAYPAAGSLAEVVIAGGEAVFVEDGGMDGAAPASAVAEGDTGALLVAPLATGESVVGVLTIANRRGAPGFSEVDLSMLAVFAGQVALALKVAEGRRDRERVVVLEDRDRIARDLHDVVIQRLFATGLGLQGLTRYIADPAGEAHLVEYVDELDRTIRDIRNTIFSLRLRVDADGGLRRELLATVDEAAAGLGLTPRVQLSGPIDAAVAEETGRHLLAVLSEALSNVVRHAQASKVDVFVDASQDRLVLRVVDDGVGIGTPERSSGLRNMAERADKLGGTFANGPGRDGGTDLEWTVPL